MANTRNVLLSIVGLSPQVVTETLFGIHQEGLEWPDEIHIITTKKGKEQVRLGLLTPKAGEQLSFLEKFCKDYDKTIPLLTVDTIHVVPDAEGKEVDDARTFEDQEALADFIVHKVAQLCSDNNQQVHASLAGGRKTMTFFLGYAMTLFARSGDRLSHVLVDEAYEGLGDFYYPTPYTQSIKGRGENAFLDSKNATVMLAEIPFIRQRSQMKPHIRESLETESYREMVRFQNMVLDLSSLTIEFDLANQCVTINNPNDSGEPKIISFKENHLELAWYAMIARVSQLENEIKITRPVDDEPLYGHLFLQELERINRMKIVEMSMDNYIAELEDRCDKFGFSYQRTLDSLAKGLGPAFFDQRKNTLKKKLQQHFPQDVVDCLLPAGVFYNASADLKKQASAEQEKQKTNKKPGNTSGKPTAKKDAIMTVHINGKRYARAQSTDKQRKLSAYGLWIAPENITMKS
jgi:CRISPR-associated protein (TIGR02584 family)